VTRSASEDAARNRPPRSAALVSPEPSKKPGPIRVTSKPSAATSWKTVGIGCHVNGSGPFSHDSSLNTRSSAGSRTSYPTNP
jgi:hypothetical protein